jgi:hypothetical protein
LCQLCLRVPGTLLLDRRAVLLDASVPRMPEKSRRRLDMPTLLRQKARAGEVAEWSKARPC